MPARGAPALARVSSSISVLVANDQPILRDGLRAILDGERDIRVIASARDGGEAVRESERHQPQVALLGVEMAGLDGIEATRIIAERSPSVRVLLLSAHPAPGVARRALDAGARGYLSRECTGAELVKGVRAVAAGGRYLIEELAEKTRARERIAGRDGHGVESLTDSERQILKLVAEGKSNPAVARMLGLSPRTVETYRLRLMRKLDIANVASLVRYAIRHGITPLE